MKIAAIGAGHVGSATAYALALQVLRDPLALASRNLAKAQGDALNLQHTPAFCERSMQSPTATSGRDRRDAVVWADDITDRTRPGQCTLVSAIDSGAGAH